MEIRLVVRLLALFVAGSSAAFAENVRIADRPAVGPFPTIQAAVDAALEGESLLVTPGTYASFTIDAKSVNVLVTGSGEATFTGRVTVKNLGATQFAVLSRLNVTGTTIWPNVVPALDISNIAGHVRVQDSMFRGMAQQTSTGVRVDASLNVVFSNCTIVSGTVVPVSFDDVIDAGTALDSTNSSIALYGCTVTGANGTDQTDSRGGNGGAGFRGSSYGVFAAGCSFRGGKGGDGFFNGPLCCDGGSGADALRVDAAQAHLLDNTYTAGAGGIYSCGGAHGPSGQTVAAINGSIIDLLQGTKRGISATRITADDVSIPITVTGQPGDLVYVMIARRPSFVFKKVLNGTWMVPTPMLSSSMPSGVIGPSGTLVIQRSFPIADGSAAARMYWLQAMCIDTTGVPTLTGPAQVLSLDAASSPDCNGNGRLDTLDVLFGGAVDCDANLTPDACDADCNGNGQPDTCDIAAGLLPDCNGNHVPDACDIAAGIPDCNLNGIPDSCDIASHFSADANSNGIPDECESLSITWYVDPAAAPSGNGSQARPFQTLQLAVNSAFTNDTIELADGLYQGAGNRNISLNGNRLTIKSANGPSNCTIDCEWMSRALDITNSAQVSIEGVSFIRGSMLQSNGGAISASGSQLTLRDCVLASNEAGSGGAVRVFLGTLRLEECTFVANQVIHFGLGGGLGGALDVDRSQVFARACYFAGNTADIAGGAVRVYSDSQIASSVVFTHTSFIANHGNNGGAISSGFNQPIGLQYKIDHCLFAGNTAAQGGAIMGYAALAISSSTFVSNTAAGVGGSLYLQNQNGSISQIRDSIFYGSTAPQGAQVKLGSSTGTPSQLSIAHCDFQGGQSAISVAQGVLTWGAGNIDANPQFTDPDGPDNNPATYDDNDYTLSALSPCVDAADNAALIPDLLDIDGDGDTTETVPLDLFRLPRRVDVPGTPDTGAGTAPIVDMGACERQG